MSSKEVNNQSEMEQKFKSMLPKQGEYEKNYHHIKPVYDVANNKLHYQTEPFLDEDGLIKVKRVATFDVVVEPAFQVIEEYNLETTASMKDQIKNGFSKDSDDETME